MDRLPGIFPPSRTPFGLAMVIASVVIFLINAVHQFQLHGWWGFFFMYWSWPYLLVMIIFVVGWSWSHVPTEAEAD